MAKEISIDKLLPEYPYAIFCEGIDEVKFMAAYITHLVKTNRIHNNRFYAYNAGGNDEIEKKLSLYKMQDNISTK